jgi:hypothetical protein
MSLSEAKRMIEKIEQALKARARLDADLAEFYQQLGRVLGVSSSYGGGHSSVPMPTLPFIADPKQGEMRADESGSRHGVGAVTEAVLDALRAPPFLFSTSEVEKKVHEKIGPTGPTSVYVALKRLEGKQLVRRNPEGKWLRIFRFSEGTAHAQ